VTIRCARLRNIRVFTDTERIFLDRPESLLVGDNAAGKSTVLRCLALAALGPELANQAEQRPESYLRHDEERGFIEVQFGLDEALRLQSGWKSVGVNTASLRCILTT